MRALWVVMGNFAWTDSRGDFCEGRPIAVYATEEEAKAEATRITLEYVPPSPAPPGWEKEPSMAWVVEVEDRSTNDAG